MRNQKDVQQMVKLYVQSLHLMQDQHQHCPKYSEVSVKNSRSLHVRIAWQLVIYCIAQRSMVTLTFQCFHCHSLWQGTRQWLACCSDLHIRQQMSFVHYPKLPYKGDQHNNTNGVTW